MDLTSSFRCECKELAAQREGSCCEKLKQKKTAQGVKNGLLQEQMSEKSSHANSAAANCT